MTLESLRKFLDFDILSSKRHGEGIDMTLCEQLKEIINNYLDHYPNVSINTLACKSGVSASTLRRIMNASIKGDPAPHTVLNIVSATSKEKRLNKILENSQGPLAKILQDVFGQYASSNSPHCYDTDLNEILRDPINYLIYKLAANRKGVLKSNIVDYYGKIGVWRLEQLIELGLLKDIDGCYHAVNKNFSLSIEIAAKHLSELVKNYHPDKVAEGLNLFYSMSESLNEEGIQKIKEIQKNAVKKIYDIMLSPFYAGDIHYFTINLNETLHHYDQIRILQ